MAQCEGSKPYENGILSVLDVSQPFDMGHQPRACNASENEVKDAGAAGNESR